MITPKKALITWLVLIALAIVSALLNTVLPTLTLLASTVLLATALKGQQIIDNFMELAHAPKFWRGIMLGYVTILPLIILAIYLW